LTVAREQMTGERTRAINALTALLRTVDLGIDARRALTATTIAAIAAWRTRHEDLTLAVCRAEAIRLARRSRTLDGGLADNHASLEPAVTAQAPELLQLSGVGAVVAATVLLTWSHPRRSGVRRPGRHLAAAGLLRQHPSSSAQPRRRPAPEQGPAHRRPGPHGTRCTHPSRGHWFVFIRPSA
jgi:transposase